MGRRRRRNRNPRQYCTVDYLECIGYTNQGKGIVIWKNKPFHIDELIYGEKALIQVYYEDNDFGNARAIKIKNESFDRILPLGHPKFKIGTYQIPHLSNDAQDAFKNQRVRSYFPKAKDIIVGKRTYYRNKISLTNGGFMQPGKGRKTSIIPEVFDLMEIDFNKYKSEGALIIRRLDTEIVGKPGTNLWTTDTLMNKKFIIGLDSFYQVNSEMTKIAYEYICEYIPKNTIVFDLFSGAATIGIIISNKAKKVYAVEINQASHQDALKNIKLNNIQNIDAINDDANLFLRNNIIKPNVIIIDPARAGLSIDSAKAINDSNADRIIYLSCNIDTQARDIDLMHNYRKILVQPFDFFPQTFHIENLVILDKK